MTSSRETRRHTALFLTLLLGAAVMSWPVKTEAAARNHQLGRHDVTVVLVTKKGVPRTDLTKADIVAVMAGVNDYWTKATQGRIQFRLKKFVNWTAQRGGRACEPSIARALASRLKFRAGVRRHLVVVQPDMQCRWEGKAERPGSYVWAKADAPMSTEPSSDPTTLFGSRHFPLAIVVAHELGHNLGLGHTSTPGCSIALEKVCNQRQDRKGSNEYGGSDIMGGGSKTINPVWLQSLGLLPRRSLHSLNTTTSNDTVLTLQPLNSASGKRAVRLNDGRRTWFLSYFRNSERNTGWIDVHRKNGTEVFEYPSSRNSSEDVLGIQPGESLQLSTGTLTVVETAESATISFVRAAPPNIKAIAGIDSVIVQWNAQKLSSDRPVDVVLTPTVKVQKERDPDEDEPEQDPLVSLPTIVQTAEPATGNVTVAGLLPNIPYRVALRQAGRIIGVIPPVQSLPNPLDAVGFTTEDVGNWITVTATPPASGRQVRKIVAEVCSMKSGKRSIGDVYDLKLQLRESISPPIGDFSLLITVTYTEGFTLQKTIPIRGASC